MLRYVAFLRGINVGGHIAKKEQLKAAFEELGFSNVSTFKQSGNVIFETETADAKEIQAKIETKLLEKLGFSVSVVVRTFPQLKAILASSPLKAEPTEGTSFLVTLLPNPAVLPFQPPLTIPKSTAQIIAASESEVFSETHGGGEGALPNPYVESKLKMKTTTRNLNILKEIVEKYNA